LTRLFTEHTAPELVYLETKWATLMSYGMTADVLQEILPIGSTANASTLRRTVHRVAARHEAELGTEQASDIAGCPTEGPPRPIAQGTVIVGLDGGYVRNWHDKKHNFEVMVGKSLAAGRDDRYFGLVRSQDEQPRRRLGAVVQSQGLPGSPALTLLTDGGASVRALAGELAPGAAHHLDWFHIAMRLTGLGQCVKGLAPHHCSRNRLEKDVISSCARKRDFEFRRYAWRSAVGFLGTRNAKPEVSDEVGGPRVPGCLVRG
jgi:hypothetical protein